MRRARTLLLTAAFLAATTVQMKAADRSSELRQVRLLIDQQQFYQALDVLSAESARGNPDSQVTYLRGYVLYRLNRLNEAARELRSALRLDPHSLRSKYILARISETEGHRAEAIQLLEPCALADPAIEDARARISKLYWDNGQVEQAEAWTKKAIAAIPWDGSLHYRLGRIYQQTGQGALAKREFEESAKAKTADSQGVQRLMDCSRALSEGDMSAALGIRREFLINPGLDPDLLVALGTSFASSGEPEQAIELFQLAASRDPKSFQAQFNTGLALLNLNHPVEAVQPLTVSLQLVPESKQANAAVGLAYVLQGEFKEAVAPLETVRDADPHDSKTAGLLCLAYYRTGAASKAIPILRQAIAQSKDDPKFYFLLVDCFNSTEQQQAALTTASEALARFPGLAKAWLAKAQQLARLGNYHDAGPLFAKAAELGPDQVEPLLGLAESEQKDGNYETALATYQRALAKDGDVTAALGTARTLIFLGRVNEAQGVLEQTATGNADNIQVHSELSRVYARLGDKQRSEEQAHIVQQLHSQDGKPSIVQNTSP